jgi:hypothetical protein
VRAGFNADGLGFSQGAVRNPIETISADNTLLLLTTFSGTPYYRVTDTQLGSYLQDTWRVIRPLVIAIGGRADWDTLVGKTVLGPRLAANLLPFRDDRTKISVGWGIYYRPINMALWGAGLDQERIDTSYAPTGITSAAITQFVLPTSGLQQPRFNTSSVEWEQKLGSNTLTGVTLLRRVEGDGFAYEYTQPGPQGLGGVFRFQDHRSDRYSSGEVWARHVFKNKAEIYGDYIRSRARSNEALDYSLTTPYFVPQAPGPLLWDAPNRVISWGRSPVPLWGLFLTYRLEYRSGFPFDDVNEMQQLIGTPGQFRFPNYFELDVGLEKRFRFHGQTWALRASAINATNRDNPNAVNTFVNPFGFAGGQGRAFTGRLRLVASK